MVQYSIGWCITYYYDILVSPFAVGPFTVGPFVVCPFTVGPFAVCPFTVLMKTSGVKYDGEKMTLE